MSWVIDDNISLEMETAIVGPDQVRGVPLLEAQLHSESKSKPKTCPMRDPCFYSVRLHGIRP